MTEVGPSSHVNNFDLLRLFAALQVMIFHTADRLGTPIPAFIAPLWHFAGVPIFYVISGFLVSASLERSRTVADYARKRALRIYPGLWGCLLVTVVIVQALGHDVFSVEGLSWLAAQMAGLIYTPGFLAGFGDGTYNGSLWTILVELQFYIALPIIYALNRALGLRHFFLILLLLSIVAAIGIRLLLPGLGAGEGIETPLEKLARYTLAPHFYLFVLGLCLHRYGAELNPWIRGKALVWLVVYLAVTSLVSYSAFTEVLGRLLQGVLTISCAYTLPWLSLKLLRGWDLSYGIYLYHGLILNLFITAGVLHDPMLLLAVALIAVGSGTVSWLLVEKPFLKRKRQPLINAETSVGAP